MNGTQVQRLGSIVQSTTVMMDGVSTMDTGSNGAIVQMNVESIAEVKILVQGYQAEYGRSSGLQITRGQQERHEPVPRLALQRAAQFRLERQQQGEHSQRRPQADPEAAGSRLLDRRPGREAGRQQQAVLLPRARVPAAHRGQRRRSRSGCRPSWNGRETFRRRPTTSATRTPTSRIRTSPASARRRTRPPASRDGGVLGRIPANRLYQPGLNILKMWPLPNNASTTTGHNYRDHQAGREHPRLPAGGPRRLSAHAVPAGERQIPGRHSAAADLQRHDPRLQRFEDGASAHRHRRRDGQLQPQPDDVSRGDLRARREPAGRVRTDAELLQQHRGADQRHLQSEQRRARRISRCSSRTRRSSTRTTTRTASSPRRTCRSSTARGS